MSSPVHYILASRHDELIQNDDATYFEVSKKFWGGDSAALFYDNTFRNFTNSLVRRYTDRPLYLYVKLWSDEKGNLFAGPKSWRFEFSELVSLLNRKQFKVGIIFFDCSAFECLEKPNLSCLNLSGNFLAIWSTDAPWKLLYQFHWVGLIHNARPLSIEPTTLEQLGVYCGRLNEIFSVRQQKKQFSRVLIGSKKAVLNCNAETNYCPEVDVVNLREQTTREERDDALKRVSDALAYRDGALLKFQKLKNAQAVLWFMESEPTGVDFPWYEEIDLPQRIRSSFVKRKRWNSSIREDYPLFQREVVEKFIEGFVTIPDGNYVTGRNTDSEFSEPPSKRQQSNLPSFKIQKYPLTTSTYNIFMRDRNFDAEAALLPITDVNYFDACKFCELINRSLKHFGFIKDREVLRLPTELEWEVAAAGENATEYPWGNEFIKTNCNHSFNLDGPSPVGQFSPQGDSVFGCVDMSGNIREWTCSMVHVFGVTYSGPGEQNDLGLGRDVDSLQRIVIRGGSYAYHPDCVRTWVRNTQIACRADKQTGFRMVIGGTYGKE